MRALVFAMVFAVGCTEHGEGGPLDGTPTIPDDDPSRCVDGVSCTANEVCSIEGHAACNVPPPSGICNCHNGVFECESSCPTGCPEFSVPMTGDSCDGVADGATCPYEDPPFTTTRTTCQCNAGVFTCTTL